MQHQHRRAAALVEVMLAQLVRMREELRGKRVFGQGQGQASVVAEADSTQTGASPKP